MLNSKRIARLKELNANQKETIVKAMKCIERLADDCSKLEAENKRLKEENKKLTDMVLGNYRFQPIFTKSEDIIFPNTDERGLGEGDTPTDLSPLDL